MKNQDTNQTILFAKRPSGIPAESSFEFRDIKMPELKSGEVLLKTLYVSVDAGMRGFMDKGKHDNIGMKYQIGDPITSRSVAEVLDSKSDDFGKSDIVHGRLAWQKYQAMPSDSLEKVDTSLAPISTSVSILGVPGLAAYFGLLKVGEIKKGQTVVVSGAAGGVGNVAVQIAKIKGCKVVGIAGSAEKLEYLQNDLGADKAINYKTTDDLARAIADACPDGVDVFFDSVGGETFDSVLKSINKHGRVVICGEIAEYNESDPPEGPRPNHLLVQKSARIEGFVVFDFKEEFDTAKKEIAKWLDSGKMVYKENLIEGFENIPSAFIGLFKGENIGKQMVKVASQTK